MFSIQKTTAKIKTQAKVRKYFEMIYLIKGMFLKSQNTNGKKRNKPFNKRSNILTYFSSEIDGNEHIGNYQIWEKMKIKRGGFASEGVFENGS